MSLAISGVLASLLLLVWSQRAAAVQPTITCAGTNAGSSGVLTITISGAASTSGVPLSVSIVSGDYVVKVGTTATCTSTTYADSGSTGFPHLSIASSVANEYVILNDSNGQLASHASSCPVQVTTSFPGTLELDDFASPAVAGDSTIGVGSSTLTLSEAGCSSDVSLGTGVSALVANGDAGSSALDLSGTTGPLDASIVSGTVTGFSVGSVSTIDLKTEPTIIGSSAGSTTFAANLTPGYTFKGQGAGNKLDLSAGASGVTIDVPTGVASFSGGSDVFSGVTSFVGASAGGNYFIANSAGGYSFSSAGAGNELDLSGLVMPATINVPAGQVTATAFTDVFSGITSFAGTSAGGNTFIAPTTSASFTGAGTGNLLDVSVLSAPILNLSGTTISGQANDTAQTAAATEVFSNVSSFRGSSGGNTTFYGGLGGDSFAGGGTGNTLNYSHEGSGTVINADTGTAAYPSHTDTFSGITSFVGSPAGGNTFVANAALGASFSSGGSGNELDLSALATGATINAGTGTVTNTGGSDVFSGIGVFRGPSAGGTTFIAPTTSATFTGQGTGNALDLSALATSPSTPATVNVSGSSGNDTAVVGPVTETFSDVATFRGPTSGYTTFLGGPTSGLTFTGRGAAGSDVLDLSALSGAGTINADSGSASFGSVSDTFSGIGVFTGSATGASTFVPATSGNMTFHGLGNGNELDLSPLISPTVNASGSPVTTFPSGTAGNSSVQDVYTGISSFKGSSGGNTSFYAGIGGDTFTGEGTGNRLDYSNEGSGTTINANTGSAAYPGHSDQFVDISTFVGSPAGNNTFVAGSAGGDTFTGPANGNVLDLTPLTTGATINAGNGTVSFNGLSDAFSGIASFIGSGAGSTTFIAPTTAATFTGQNTGNKLDLSALAASLSTPATINVSGNTVNAQLNDTAAVGSVTERFSDVASVKGPTTGHATFLAGSANYSFTGQGAAGTNTLDLSTLSLPGTINADTGGASFGGVTDNFGGIGAFAGPSTGDTTFVADPSTSDVFTVGGGGNELDLSALTNPTLNVSGMTVSGLGTQTAQAGSFTYGFPSNVTTFKGSSAGNTLFYGGSGGGDTFAGQGSGNTLDLSALASPTVNVAGGPGNDTATSGGATDSFSDVSSFRGSSGGGSRFLAGSTGGYTFTGQAAGNTLDLSAAGSPATIDAHADSAKIGTAADAFSGIGDFVGSASGSNTFIAGPGNATFIGGTGNTLDLTGMSGLSSLTVAMAGGTCSGGAGLVTSTGASPVNDCFGGVSTVDGAASVPTRFQPNPDLTGTPSPAVQFVGHDSSAAGSIVDLSKFTSPDAGGHSVSGLTASLNTDSAKDPGTITATVDGSPVTFASFSGVNELIGSSSLSALLIPGATTGVTLVNIAGAPQTVTFTTSPPASATVGESYVPHATGGGSGNPVAISVDASSTGVCAITSGTVAFTGAGACRIDANQAGTSEYAAAPQAQQTITVTKPSGIGGPGPTSQQIKAVLGSEISPPAALRIRTLLKGGGLSLKFKALEAGTATVSWYAARSGKRHKGQKPVLIASGKLSFATAITGKLKIKLTRAGKKLLATEKKLRVTSDGAFKPPNGSVVKVIKTFTLKR